MNITILKEFVSLYETCSFQETSELLSISQSALTKHIHKLEEDLGILLFDRSTRSVTLNDFSRAFYPYAQQIVTLESESRDILKNVISRSRNTLRIAFTPSTSHYDLVDFLSYFSKRNPNVDFQMEESTMVVETLDNNQCEFAFATDNDTIDSKYRKVIYQKDHLVIIVPQNHPLATRTAVTLDDIKNESFILHQNSRGGLHLESRQLMEHFDEHGIQPQVVSKVSFTSTILKFVEHGNCIAALPYNRVPDNTYGIKILDFVPHIESNIYMIYPAHKKIEGASAIFLRFIIENIEESK